MDTLLEMIRRSIHLENNILKLVLKWTRIFTRNDNQDSLVCIIDSNGNDNVLIPLHHSTVYCSRNLVQNESRELNVSWKKLEHVNQKSALERLNDALEPLNQVAKSRIFSVFKELIKERLVPKRFKISSSSATSSSAAIAPSDDSDFDSTSIDASTRITTTSPRFPLS